MKNYLIAAAVVALVLASFAGSASHGAQQEGNYFTAGVVGDNYILSGVVVPHPDEDEDPLVNIDFEEEFGWQLGGYAFFDIQDTGRYHIDVEDDEALAGPSGAYRVEDAEANTVEDNVDTCFDETLTTQESVPVGGAILIWIDGVVWWAIGSPCDLGQTSQGTFGTITITHA